MVIGDKKRDSEGLLLQSLQVMELFAMTLVALFRITAVASRQLVFRGQPILRNTGQSIYRKRQKAQCIFPSFQGSILL